jgi:hypothetical protein
VGLVDSASGPGVFFRLSELRPGDRVYVTRAGFPTGAVYAATADPELRLITCGAAFDYEAGHYLSNVIVYGTDAG